jgi:predicted acyl esterase
MASCTGSATAFVPEARDTHWAPESLPPLPSAARFGSASPVAAAAYSARYLTLRDGCRVAVDVHLPPGPAGATFDAVLVQCRYGRAVRARWLGKALLHGGKPVDLVNIYFKQVWLAAGLAVVAMDCRGTGASFGTWGGPWLEGEAEDGAEVLAWAARQPWSSGRFALFGQSYEAGTALALAALPCLLYTSPSPRD